MKQYEYDVITNSEYIKAKFLTAKGEQGWELVSHTYIPGITVPHVYTFKRKKIEVKQESRQSDFIAEYLKEEIAKYKDVPTVVVNKDHNNLMKDLREAVVSDTPASSWMDEHREAYDKLLKSGMFFEFHPTWTGEWDQDKYAFCYDKKYENIVRNKKK